MPKVIHTLAPEPCIVCKSRLLAVYYVGSGWVVDRIVCGKCGAIPLKNRVSRWDRVVQESVE